MKLVVSDPKTGKAYSKTIESSNEFFDKKIGDTIKLTSIGLNDYEAIITGGSDNDGFPMRKDFVGTTRKKNFNVKNKKKGLRVRIMQRGNTVAKDISQLNIKITKAGAKKLDELISPEKKEEKISVKEKLVKASLKTAGTGEQAKIMEKQEFKKGEKK